MLNALQANDIHDVVFIAGFHQEQLRDFVAQAHPSVRPVWIENPVYEQTNTAYSVHLSQDHFLASGDDMLLINGDVVLDHRAIRATLANGDGNVLATRFDRCGAEEVKVRLHPDGSIAEIGKHLQPGEAAGESVGINYLKAAFLPEFYSTLRERIENGEGRREFYEHSFNALIQQGALFHTADVTHLPVMEVDTPEDYETVQRALTTRLEQN